MSYRELCLVALLVIFGLALIGLLGESRKPVPHCYENGIVFDQTGCL